MTDCPGGYPGKPIGAAAFCRCLAARFGHREMTWPIKRGARFNGSSISTRLPRPCFWLHALLGDACYFADITVIKHNAGQAGLGCGVVGV